MTYSSELAEQIRRERQQTAAAIEERRLEWQQQRAEQELVLSAMFGVLSTLVRARISGYFTPDEIRDRHVLEHVEWIQGEVGDGHNDGPMSFFVSNYDNNERLFAAGAQQSGDISVVSYETDAHGFRADPAYLNLAFRGGQFTTNLSPHSKGTPEEHTELMRAAGIVQDVLERAQPEDILVRVMVPLDI